MRAQSTRLLGQTVVIAVLVVWAAAPRPVLGQASAPEMEDLIIGAWKLDLARSKYSPGPAPRGQTRRYEPHPEGVKTTIETTHADGRSTSVQYVAKYDSIQYPVTGSTQVDAIALKRINAFMAEATITHAGRTIGTARRVVSEDGRTMTISYRDAKGLINVVAVYEKQTP